MLRAALARKGSVSVSSEHRQEVAREMGLENVRDLAWPGLGGEGGMPGQRTE